jgi:hypothetical protein
VKEASVVRTLTIVLLCLGASGARAESTRTLKLQLSGDPSQPFRVENLAGTMHVSVGGDTVSAVATVHAESDALAGSVRFEQVAGENGAPTLRLRYPLDQTIRYTPGGEGHHGSSTVNYDGARAKVSGSSGVLLWAEVEVQVPAKDVDGVFRNAVGPVSGEGVHGQAKFDTGTGRVSVRNMQGVINADTGSGDVTASDVEGSLGCNTGSGSCEVTGFKGDRLSCDTGSGNVRVRTATAHRIATDTGSGNVSVEGADTVEFVADTGSGNVDFDALGNRLTSVKADTGSGNVRLRLGPDATFEARADTGNGDVVSRYSDAEAIVHGREVVGYRRGDAKIRIRVDTGSGDLVLQP